MAEEKVSSAVHTYDADQYWWLLWSAIAGPCFDIWMYTVEAALLCVAVWGEEASVGLL